MRLGVAAVMFLLLTGAVHAAEWNSIWRQEKYCPPDRKGRLLRPRSRTERLREVDEAYRDAIQHHPAPAPVATDPWGGVRAGEATSVKKKKKKR